MEETLDFFSSSLLPPSPPSSPPPFLPPSSSSSPPSYPPPSSFHPPSVPPPFLPFLPISPTSYPPPRFLPPTSFSRDESAGLFPLHIEESINDTYLNEIEKILDGIQSPESSPIGKRSQILLIDQSLQKRDEGEMIIKENGIENKTQGRISMNEGRRLEEEESIKEEKSRKEERNRMENGKKEEKGCKEKKECKINYEQKDVHLDVGVDEVIKEEELKNVVAKSKNCYIF